MKKSLLALAFGTLGLGIAEFVMMGILPDVAANLHISIEQAGHFISAYALGVCCGAPALILARRFPLKHILLALVSVVIAGNLFATAASGYWTLLSARFISGLNIWTTNDNALYTAGLGLSNITKVRKRPMVVISGILGTVTAVWLYNNFVGWLNILNCTLPPVGMIVVLGYFCHKEEYEKWDVIPRQVNWFAIAGVLIGAAVANLVPWGIASVNGMVIAAVCYLVGELVEWKKKK